MLVATLHGSYEPSTYIFSALQLMFCIEKDSVMQKIVCAQTLRILP